MERAYNERCFFKLKDPPPPLAAYAQKTTSTPMSQIIRCFSGVDQTRERERNTLLEGWSKWQSSVEIRCGRTFAPIRESGSDLPIRQIDKRHLTNIKWVFVLLIKSK